jgi:acetylornithine/N-succinyldiaminopimelate aminotransferase
MSDPFPTTTTHPVIVESAAQATMRTFERYVVPSYARSLVLERGKGIEVWDADGKRYLDFGGGIAVNALGHAHPAITKTLTEQSQQLIHVSNLYYNKWQGQLAEKLVSYAGSGKVFFCNSGAEANEMLYKLARRFGHDTGRFEVITALKSFHGRTLGGLGATGQDKIKKGFEPIITGFKYVPYNDLEAVKAAITPQTSAVLIECIQAEGGVNIATPEYLLGLRKLCTERNLLLLIDEVQGGMFRTGSFADYERILEGHPEAASFKPDAISMAKALGGGFPIGAVWLKTPHGDLFGPGSHGTTFGGTPLACAVALTVLDVIEREHLVANIRKQGDKIIAALKAHIASGAKVLKDVRGFGCLIGMQVKSPAAEQAARLRAAGLLVVPAGDEVLRLLPPYNLTDEEVEEALGIIRAQL